MAQCSTPHKGIEKGLCSIFAPASFFKQCLFASLGLFLIITTSTAQTSFPLTPAATKVLVDTLAGQISKYYVSKDTAVKMSACLKKKLKEGRYAKVNDPHTLAALLTEDVNSVYRDEHFHVEYNPTMIDELSGNIEDVPKLVEEKLNRERSKNFGFKKAEILNGNIGYLEISSFSRLNQYSKETATAALKLLANSRAIIIDLRYGMGGSPEMINYLMGYFFKEKIHVSDVYIRSEKARVSYTTLPDTTAGRLTEIPVYILTSYKTFSAAEGLSYELHNLKRATLVGETTRGGAHTVSYRALSSGFIVDLPFGNVISPITKTNWEKTGITPDILIPADKALEKTETMIMEKALAEAKNQGEKDALQWQLDLLLSSGQPATLTPEILKNRAGSYGAYKIELQEEKLSYQKAGKARFILLPLDENSMKVKGNDSFRVEFKKDETGKVNSIVTHYEDGRIETAMRTSLR